MCVVCCCFACVAPCLLFVLTWRYCVLALLLLVGGCYWLLFVGVVCSLVNACCLLLVVWCCVLFVASCLLIGGCCGLRVVCFFVSCL